ncbi:hypothetical protein [Algoriphagus sp.]|uniref:hypothetical protein n=1 Tax=Algoriphagus sp. TaxID=1872435 RepID=UPI0032895ABD
MKKQLSIPHYLADVLRDKTDSIGDIEKTIKVKTDSTLHLYKQIHFLEKQDQ